MASRSIAIRITLENRDAVRGMQEQTRVTKEAGVATDRLTHLQAGLTNSFIKGNLAARAISVAYLSLRDSLYFAIGGALDLEVAFAKTQAVTGETGRALASMKENVFALSRANSVAIKEIAGASLELAKLGFEGENLNKSLTGVVQLSAILGDSLEATGKLVGGIANTFSLTSSQVETVAEKLFVATGKSATDIEGFGVSFNFAGAAAAEAGVSFEQLSSLIAILSNRGLRASTIGTGLRTFFINMSNEGSKASQALGGGFEKGGLIGVLERLGNLKPDNQSLFAMFGKPGLPVAANLKNIKDEFVNFTAEISKSNGELAKGAELINSTVLGSVTRLKNSIVELVTVFDFKPVSSFFDFLAKGVNKATDAFNESKEFENFTKRSGAKSVQEALGLPMNASVEQIQKAWGPIFEGLKEARKMAQQEASLRKLLQEDANKILEGDIKSSSIIGTKPTKPPKQIQIEFDKAKRKTVDLEETPIEKASREKAVSDEKKREKRLQNSDQIQKLESQAKKEFLERDKFSAEGVNTEDKLLLFELEFQEKLRIYEQYQVDTTLLNEAHEIQRNDLIKQLAREEFALRSNQLASFAGGMSQLFGQLAKENKKFVALAKTFAIAEVIFNTAVAVSKVWGQTGIFGIAAQVAPLAAGAAQIMAINSAKFASGTDQFVDRPTSFVAGESGRERVKVTPAAKVNKMDPEQGGVTFIIQGDVYDYDRFMHKVKRAQQDASFSYA